MAIAREGGRGAEQMRPICAFATSRRRHLPARPSPSPVPATAASPADAPALPPPSTPSSPRVRAVIKTGVISQAAGSAYVEFDATKVMCGVYGPRQGSKTASAATTDRGRLDVDVRLAAFATPGGAARRTARGTRSATSPACSSAPWRARSWRRPSRKPPWTFTSPSSRLRGGVPRRVRRRLRRARRRRRRHARPRRRVRGREGPDEQEPPGR